MKRPWGHKSHEDLPISKRQVKVVHWISTPLGKDKGTDEYLYELSEKKLPYISICTDPTTGGTTASFAMLGDINIAEPKAQVGFAGPRVIEDTVRVKLPDGFQRSEFLLNHGMIDMIVHRSELKDKLSGLISKLHK